jgi:diketogulonate reductase-like aldo/keto reductase
VQHIAHDSRLLCDSLEKLGHIDLVLLHAPGDPVLRGDTWRALEACLVEGMVANIGVSNFGQAHLEKLARTAATPPAVNQIEVHPALQRRELVAYCAAQGICVEAYSPLAKGRLLKDATVCAVATDMGVTPAQVLLRWSIQKGFVTLPNSVNAERQAKNLDLFSFALSDAHMAALDALERGFITGWDPITQDPV